MQQPTEAQLWCDAMYNAYQGKHYVYTQTVGECLRLKIKVYRPDGTLKTLNELLREICDNEQRIPAPR